MEFEQGFASDGSEQLSAAFLEGSEGVPWKGGHK